MTVEALLAKASEGFNAGRAFGPIIERDDCLIIPVAFVAGGGGGGDALESTEGTAGVTGGGFGGVTGRSACTSSRTDRCAGCPRSTPP